MTYSFNKINWMLTEIKMMDTKVRKFNNQLQKASLKSRYRMSLCQQRNWWKRLNPNRINL